MDNLFVLKGSMIEHSVTITKIREVALELKMARKAPLQTVFLCLDCTSECQDATKLHCLKHFVCSKCFQNRYHAADTKHDMVKCSVCYDFNESPGIYIFVDDSNIWIAAKALQSKLRHLKTVEDHRVRIDVGKLADVLAGGRPVAHGVLFGSEPPPVDTVWNKIKEKGWRVITDKRHKFTGKEKQVDTRLVAEVTGRAIRTPNAERTTIVLVTGDADVIPAIQEAMKEAHWTVEVCMWKHAMSQKLSRFAKDNHGRVVIRHLDDFVDKVSFTEKRFKISNKILYLVKKGGVVFSIEEKAFRKGGDFHNRIPTQSWLNQLESIAQWPFQYYWFDSHKSGKTNDLVLVFRPDPKAGDFDIKQFVTDIELETDGEKKQYRLSSIIMVQTFLEYSQHIYEQPVDSDIQKFDGALEQVGIYNDEEALAGSDNDVIYETDPSNGWKACRRKPHAHGLRQQYSESCQFKFNCKHGTRCQNRHTEDEKTYFKGRIEGRGNPVRKIGPCIFFEKPQGCVKMKHECEYAHGSEDAWCLNCLNSGHFTDDCPEQKPLSC